MSRIFKSIISVIIIISVCLGLSVPGSAETADNRAQALRFANDGKLRIMHVTDTHLGPDNVDDSVLLIEKACDREKPDVVMLTGDIASNEDINETHRLIDRLMSVFETRDIPVAVTFGNHDSENGTTTREELMAYFNTFSCSVSVDDGDSLSGCGTYYIPVLSSKDNTVKFILWVFDSGDYDSEGHYANVTEDCVEWYKETSEKIERENGAKIPSLAFQHIIVPEIYDALEQVKVKGAFTYSHLYNKKTYYRFDKNAVNFGMLHETPCCGYYNHGQFDAMVQRQDVLAVFSGHDHTNAYGVRYKNIDIVNSLSTRYQGDTFSTQYGYRMIVLDENDTSSYTTYSVHWYDFFSSSDMKEMRKSDDPLYKTALRIRFLGFFKKVFLNIAIFFVEFFTFRTVKYPD